MYIKLSSLLLFAFLGNLLPMGAQTYPLDNYTELNDNLPFDNSKWENLDKKIYVSWASKDIKYKKAEVPSIKIKKDTIMYAWKGEKVGIEALIFSPITTEKLELRLKSTNRAIEAVSSEARFVNYVITDNFKSCGSNPYTSTKYLVPDVIDTETTKSLEAKTTRPIWCSLEIPRNIDVGIYTLTLEIYGTESNKKMDELTLRVNIQDKTLPEPKDYTFHLDFWLQPYAISRYYQVPKWSQAHFDAMRPYIKRLARAGQNVATAILFYEPWGNQSHDKFDPMIETIKKYDGSWSYDYAVFDRWIEFLDSCGVNKQINCFSMVPWDMSFRYYDETTSSYKTIKTTTSTSEYKNIWTSFLTAFATHLKEKGWYDKTCIAMDERGLSAMQDAYNVLQSCVPGMKMSLAGNYHKELVDKLYDYCLAYGQKFSDAELKNRKDKGFISTTYTCCSDPKPNTCTNCMPAEATYLPIYCIANNFDGYLRWSYMNWAEDPLRDSRFRLFTPGDTYIVYPGNRSSIRFERFLEGIQATEKVRLLRQQFTTDNNQLALAKLDSIVNLFTQGSITSSNPASETVNLLHSFLNNSPVPQKERPEDYCEIEISEQNKNTAIQKRWLTSAITTGCTINLNYKSSTKSETGWIIAPNTIQVTPGSSFTLRAIPTKNDDDIRFCRAGLYADWNRDTIFDTTSNELVAQVGNANTNNTSLLDYSFKVNVPTDAKLGLTRLRLCYADAWKEQPQPCGELYKGFALDIPMEINTNTKVGTTKSNNSYNYKNNILTVKKPSNIFIYNTNGQCLEHTSNVKNYSFEEYTPGIYFISIVSNNEQINNIRIIKHK